MFIHVACNVYIFGLCFFMYVCMVYLYSLNCLAWLLVSNSVQCSLFPPTRQVCFTNSLFDIQLQEMLSRHDRVGSPTLKNVIT